MYKKYLLSVFVLFMAFAVLAPQSASAFWPFDYFKNNAVQTENTAAVQTSDTASVCQIVELFISLGIIPQDKAAQARQAVSNYCSSSSSSSSPISISPPLIEDTILVNQPYFNILTADGDFKSVAWGLSAGEMPRGKPGIGVYTKGTSTAVLEGTPTVSGKSVFKIRATNLDKPSVWGEINGNINVLEANQYPSINLLSPNGGEIFRAGGTYDVRWSGINFPSNGTVTITLVDEGLVSKQYLFSEIINDGIERWAVPFNIPTGKYKIRIFCGIKGTEKYCGDNPKSEDFSNNSFSIVNDNYSSSSSSSSSKPSITVLSPNGGEKWQVGKTYPIKWTSLDSVSQYVRIAILKDNQIIDQLGAGGVNNNGNYPWTIPNIPGDNYKVKIYDINNESISDSSNASFSIISASSTQNLPDLKVSDLKISPSVANVGQEILLTATLSNIGNVVAIAKYNIDWGYQGISSKSDQNICYSGIDLNPGEKCLIASKVKYSSPVSSNRIKIMVDPGNYIKELNETNNTRSISFPIIASSSSSSTSADITATTGKVESYSNGARVYGAISNPNKENVWYYFKYRKEADPSTETKQSPWTSINSQSTGGAVIFLYNLLPNTKYVYQLYAYSYTTGKTVNGELKSFTTLSSTSTLTLTDISSVSTLIDNGTSAPATSTVAFKFTMNNRGTADLYVSKNQSVFVATSTTSGSLGSLTLLSADPTTLSGDSSTAYFIPSGSSRKFTLLGSFGKYSTSGTIEFKITKIYFDDDTTGLQEFYTDSGLEKLSAVVTF